MKDVNKLQVYFGELVVSLEENKTYTPNRSLKFQFKSIISYLRTFHICPTHSYKLRGTGLVPEDKDDTKNQGQGRREESQEGSRGERGELEADSDKEEKEVGKH